MRATTSKTLYAYLALAVSLVILGFSAVFVLLAGAPGTVTAFYRMGIAVVLVTLPYGFQVRQQSEASPSKGVFLAILGGIFFAFDVALWSTGITLSGATNPTLLANTAPLWVGLGAWLIFHERLKPLFWIGLGLAMLGAGLVLANDLSRAAEVGIGTLLGLLAAVFYGAYFLTTQRGRAYLNTVSYFWIWTLSSAVLLLVLNLSLRQPLTGYSAQTYLYFLGLGAIVQVVGWLLITYAQGVLPASIVSPTLLGQPVTTALIASLLLGESFTLQQIAGGLIVLSGVYLVHRSRWNNPGRIS